MVPYRETKNFKISNIEKHSRTKILKFKTYASKFHVNINIPSIVMFDKGGRNKRRNKLLKKKEEVKWKDLFYIYLFIQRSSGLAVKFVSYSI